MTSAPTLGVDAEWIAQHRGDIDHFFHLAAIYDMTADDATNEAMNVEGTRHALALAAALEAGCFHQVSSVAAAGDYRGPFDESMFDEGQHLPSPYHRTKFESEQIVREECPVPWRVYRPAIVVGDSQTGAMDKVDGPYYFFPMMKPLRDRLPAWLPLVGVDLGDTNVVPVDYVAKAMDHLAHLRRPRRRGLPPGQPRAAAGRRHDQLVLPGRRGADSSPPRSTAASPRPAGGCRAGSAPRRCQRRGPVSPVQAALDQTVGRAGVPPEVLGHTAFTARFDSHRHRAGAGRLRDRRSRRSSRTPRCSGTTGRRTSTRPPHATRGAQGAPGQVRRDHRRLLRHRPGHRAQGGAGRWHPGAGGPRQGQARGPAGRPSGCAAATAHVFPCDLSDLEAIDRLCEQLTTELPSVDFLVNNAGRSIRRSLKLYQDRFHDFERTMQLNYFGAIRLIIGLMPTMREQQRAHIVNISSIGVQTNPPRFSAYVASKAALDAWSNVVASELVGDGITFTSVHMPLVRTPMIAPTKLYDKFPTIRPAQAADRVIKAMVEKPHELNTLLGNAGAVAHTMTPKTSFRMLNMAYQVFPDSAAAEGAEGAGTRESEQVMLARLFRGVHW